MPAGFRAAVPPISGEPNAYGLLGGCIDVVTADVHQLNGTDTVSLSCADSNLWYQCDVRPGSPTPDNPGSKTFDRPEVCEYDPVTVYAGVTCSTFGITHAEGQTRALEQLRVGEQRALERFYMEQVLCGYAAGNDLTPAAGALSITVGVGMLEGWLAENYGGEGVLHVPAGVAALMSAYHLITFGTETSNPSTLMGNCVVLGAGYQANLGPVTPGPGCAPAPAGEAWLYITPPVRVRRDQPALVQREEKLSVNTSTNDRYVLAESTFVVETACCTAAAVRVTIC